MEVPVVGRRAHASLLYLPTRPTPDTPDPLGILKVNGIYGPGTWAGWLLTIFASWLAIFTATRERNRKGVRHDLIMHLVFTNWAAIDVFRQLGFRQAASDDEARKELGGAIAAALMITFWGLLTALWQLGFCVFFDKDNGTDSSSRTVWDLVLQYKRCIVLLVGTVLPSIALFVFECYLPGLTDKGGGIADSVPAFHLDGTDPGIHWGALVGAGTIGMWSVTFSFLCLAFVALCYFSERHNAAGLLGRQVPLFDGDMDFPAMLIIPVFLSFCLSAFISFFISGTYLLHTFSISIGFHIFFILLGGFYAFIVLGLHHESMWRTILGVLLLPSALSILVSHILFLGAPALHVWWWLVDTRTRNGDSRKNCFAMPCTPQKISDWDQAFGLMVGLVMLAVEVVPGFVGWVLRKTGEEKVPSRAYTVLNERGDDRGTSV